MKMLIRKGEITFATYEYLNLTLKLRDLNDHFFWPYIKIKAYGKIFSV